MVISKEKKQAYIDDVQSEMKRRGFTSEEIPVIIGKTGFMDAIEQYPEEQLHYDVSDAVDEIIMTAARK
ncbi:hypothetical protein SAMN05660668_01299 [Pseudobutyrivibrio sp. AR14]|uniref:hypothetical protein n=1 Tax=Pseudobutyrivibrio sp. AR14 TaxID=1520804 RepID=UPI000887DF86|nr:hypothetical protein [Pseudobutyrivibrio sp. AR14]SCY05705.1 hypothetical protein SAMN05660668_01299 [Pseudobutyrivibrio sp. AR14]